MLKNCNFYCCDEFKFELSDPDGTDARHWTYCPYCGAKLR